MSETVKRKIERYRQEGESYNDVLERLLAEADDGVYDGIDRWSDEEAESVRESRRTAKKKRKRRMRKRAGETE